jgi:DNA polymerase-3 subunit delta
VKISPRQLGANLARSLAPIYVIGGDEPLQFGEAVDAVRTRAREAGYDEREVHFAERGFDWNLLHEAGASLSLFSRRRLIELRFEWRERDRRPVPPSPGEQGADALVRYAADPPPDTLLLVLCPNLDWKAATSRWASALERAGVLVETRAVSADALPGWIDQRMRAAGLVPSPDAVRALAERVEGNLLAAAQEIEKLRLLRGAGAVDEDAVREAVVDSARFDAFLLADAVFAGETARALRVLEGLRTEGVEPPVILWPLVRDLRWLAALAWEKATRKQSSVAAEIWKSRRGALAKAAARVRVRECHTLLLRAGEVDRTIKGRGTEQPWEALAGFVAAVAGACAA